MQFNHSTGRNLRVLLVAPLSNPLIAMDKALVSLVPAEVSEELTVCSICKLHGSCINNCWGLEEAVWEACIVIAQAAYDKPLLLPVLTFVGSNDLGLFFFCLLLCPPQEYRFLT